MYIRLPSPKEMPNLENLLEIMFTIANELKKTRDINSLVRASRYVLQSDCTPVSH